MDGHDHRQRDGQRHVRCVIATLAFAVFCSGSAVQAQYLAGPHGYDRGPPPGYEDEVYDRRYRPSSRTIDREPVGLNCAAVQQGLSGPQPYSCPLPGPRPIGVRCFCNLPIASFSAPQTAVGRVVR